MFPRGRRAVAWRAAVIAIVAAAAVILATRGGSQSAPPPRTSTAAQSWTLPRLGASGDLSLASLRGHPVVVDFFASWCTACQGELPGLRDLSQKLRGQVTFVGVDSVENGNGLAMAHQYGIDAWPLVRDVGGAEGSGLHDNLNAAGMPVTALYDASGHLREVTEGAIAESDLSTRIRALFGVVA